MTSHPLIRPRSSLSPISLSSSETGTALVEFALVLPILILVVMSILWFGRALNYSQDETHLANVAARYAAVDQVPPEAEGLTLSQWVLAETDSSELKSGGTYSMPSPAQVCITYPDGKGVGDPVEVKVTSTFHWLPVLKLGPSSILVGAATMRIEVPPTKSFFAETGACP